MSRLPDPGRLRPYTPADRRGCLAVFRSNVPTYFRDDEQADFERFIDTSGEPYLVLVRGGEVAACGGYGLRPGADAADLCWGMVRREAHGERLGERLLVARLDAIVRTMDVRAVRLVTSQHTDGFFARYGFRVVERSCGALAEGLDAVEMRLELTAAARSFIRDRSRAMHVT